jgi:hypothetical protein
MIGLVTDKVFIDDLFETQAPYSDWDNRIIDATNKLGYWVGETKYGRTLIVKDYESFTKLFWNKTDLINCVMEYNEDEIFGYMIILRNENSKLDTGTSIQESKDLAWKEAASITYKILKVENP